MADQIRQFTDLINAITGLANAVGVSAFRPLSPWERFANGVVRDWNSWTGSNLARPY